MGHKFDTIFHANRKELGLIEVGKKIDQTKEMKDGLVKMLIVMHDMLINLATIKEFLRKVKVVGRVINAMMGSPGGFLSSIRRSNALEYLSCREDFIGRSGLLFCLCLLRIDIHCDITCIISIHYVRKTKVKSPPVTFFVFKYYDA
ncbi:hypothetical protein BDC45DRAFT_559392 [Circinella umbellata]|nr:hypothetical protein BDC45DRAFT_559392 [Circinella umbellata]